MIRTARASLVLVAILLAVSGLPGAGAAGRASAPGNPTSSVVFTGHGFGHGRGLGQWGSLGYALNGWPHTQILDHFYGGTVLVNETQLYSPPDPRVTVRLVAADGLDTIVFSPNGGIQIGGFGGTSAPAVLVHRTGSQKFSVSTGPSCAGPWSVVASMSTSAVVIGTSLAPTSIDNLLQRCESGRTRSYRGEILAVDTGAAQATVNRVLMEDYLRGVVPQESPAGWADQGGGAGAAALRAQSVAARSYARAENRSSFAKTCDTTSCQVYGGAAVNPTGGTRTMVEDPRTDAAIAATAGLVRVFNNTQTVARTEFSSSTGGYSAPGVFPAVPDAGDAVASNPHHDWTVVFTPESIANALGVSWVSSMTVVERNGLGVDGGRVLRVEAQTSSGTRSLTGDQVRAALGLRSNWFSITWTGTPDPGPAGGYRLGADGTLKTFGAAPASGVTVGAGTGRAVAIGGPSRTAGYVLTAGGSLVSVGGAPAVADGPTWGFDAARDLELRADGQSGYLLDMNGGVWPFGGAPTPNPGVSVYRNDGTAVSLALRPDGSSGYVAFADGTIGTFGAAPPVAGVPIATGRRVTEILLRADHASLVVVDDAGGLIQTDGVVLRAGGAPGAVVAADQRPDASGQLLSGGGQLTAVLGAPTLAAAPTTGVVDLALVPELQGYTLDFAGGLHPFGGAPAPLISRYFGGWDIARGVAIGPSGAGLVLDGWGGLHPFGTPASPAPSPSGATGYWPGWDIARAVVLLPDRDDAGYVLSGWGGLHSFGGAPSIRGGPYWPGWDIARAVALLPDGTGGYLLDGWGGTHPFAIGSNPMPPVPSGGPYFPGRDVARSLTVFGPARGVVLERNGAVHGFGMDVESSFVSDGTTASGIAGGTGEWLTWTDTTGRLHSANGTPGVVPTATWSFSAVRGIATIP